TVRKSYLGSIGDWASGGWELGHDALGDNVAGHVAGVAGAGLAGGARTLINTGAAILGAMAGPGYNGPEYCAHMGRYGRLIRHWHMDPEGQKWPRWMTCDEPPHQEASPSPAPLDEPYYPSFMPPEGYVYDHVTRSPAFGERGFGRPFWEWQKPIE